jgi:hypothetical protein
MQLRRRGRGRRPREAQAARQAELAVVARRSLHRIGPDRAEARVAGRAGPPPLRARMARTPEGALISSKISARRKPGHFRRYAPGCGAG